MKSVICTLFEGHYHFGVAALANSLYKQGFRGAIYAGYRGMLPKWAAAARRNPSLNWHNGRTCEITKDLKIHFLPLATNYHLTNYKPDFMLELWHGVAKDADAIFYFDPDIVVVAPWSFFERWIKSGVALCEDVNSPLTKNHPNRIAWRQYFEKFGFKLIFKDQLYVNGGFVGVNFSNYSFVKTWREIQECMASAIGGLERSAFVGGQQLPLEAQGDFAPFGKTDQDALNATVEAWDGECSFMTQEAMGFRRGLAIVPHALGQPKPWDMNPLVKAINGKSPRLVDRIYWNNVSNPIMSHSSSLVRKKNLMISIAAFIGRFYTRK